MEAHALTILFRGGREAAKIISKDAVRSKMVHKLVGWMCDTTAKSEHGECEKTPHIAAFVEFLTLELNFCETSKCEFVDLSWKRNEDHRLSRKQGEHHTLVDLQLQTVLKIHPVENTWDLTGLAAWGCCGLVPGLQNSKAELSGASRDGRVLGAFCVRGKCNSPFHRKCVKTWQPMTSKLVQ